MGRRTGYQYLCKPKVWIALKSAAFITRGRCRRRFLSWFIWIRGLGFNLFCHLSIKFKCRDYNWIGKNITKTTSAPDNLQASGPWSKVLLQVFSLPAAPTPLLSLIKSRVGEKLRASLRAITIYEIGRKEKSTGGNLEKGFFQNFPFFI